MPELPEVETVANHLGRLITGRKIETAELIRERLAPSLSPTEFSDHLSGATIRSIGRRGKHILFDLDNEKTLIVHLRMSGRFQLLNGADEDPKFTHAIFSLAGGERLLFVDQRHFGMMNIVESANLHETKEIAKLAPEPFSDDFTEAYFLAVLKSTKRPLKECLLDQTKVCGVGNIYASEAMFIARAKPTLAANKLSAKKARVLRAAVRGVMNETIELGRSIPVDPANIGGNIYGTGSDAEWRVYGREGLPCPNCTRPITRITQSTRSTFLCQTCQR